MATHPLGPPPPEPRAGRDVRSDRDDPAPADGDGTDHPTGSDDTAARRAATAPGTGERPRRPTLRDLFPTADDDEPPPPATPPARPPADPSSSA